MALSGHSGGINQCPLSGVKRTWLLRRKMSAFDPKGHRFLSVYWWRTTPVALNFLSPASNNAKTLAGNDKTGPVQSF